MHQKSDISERRNKPLLHYTAAESVRPVRGHLTTKINITFFYQKLNAEYIFFNNFFKKKKKTVFSEKNGKNYFGGTFNNFLGKGGDLRQKLT